MKLEEEIKSLQLEVEGNKGNLEIKQNELQKLKDNSFKFRLDALRKELSLAEQELVSYKTRHEQYQSMLSSNSMRSEEIQEKILKLEDDLTEGRPRADKTKVDLNDLEERLISLNELLLEENELMSEKSAAYNQENIQFHQSQNRLNNLRQEITYKQEAFNSSK